MSLILAEMLLALFKFFKVYLFISNLIIEEQARQNYLDLVFVLSCKYLLLMSCWFIFKKRVRYLPILILIDWCGPKYRFEKVIINKTALSRRTQLINKLHG